MQGTEGALGLPTHHGLEELEITLMEGDLNLDTTSVVV